MHRGAEPTAEAGVLQRLVVPQLKSGIPPGVRLREGKPLGSLPRKRRERHQGPRVAEAQEEPELIAVIEPKRKRRLRKGGLK